MNSIGKLALALVLAGGLAAPAFADQTSKMSGAATPNTTNSDQSGTNSQSSTSNRSDANMPSQAAKTGSAMHMAQKLRGDLSKAGYTDITVMPSGFMVRAKDSQGNPVMMMISPDSVTAVTEENAASNANHGSQNNTGGANNGNMQPAQPNATKP